MSSFHKLTIKTIHRETPDCVTLSFLIPDALTKDYQFTAGQYLTLKATVNGEMLRRDYSICSSPNSGELKVAVKAVKEGRFSNYVNTQLKENDSLEVATPKGRFVFNPLPNAQRKIVAFAAGSGITPILSIAKSVLESEPNSEFILVYGNKSIADTIFFQELVALQKTYDNRFHLQFLFSRTQEKDALFGRIEKSVVNLIVKNKFKDAHIDAFYICGPSDMINVVQETLKENTISDDRIFYELFTAPEKTDESDIIDDTITKGETTITVVIDDEETSFTMPQSKTILEASLKADLDAPYSCQGGICSSCIARVTEGHAIMQQNNILTDGEISDGLILTCQAHPKTQRIKVDYDDV